MVYETVKLNKYKFTLDIDALKKKLESEKSCRIKDDVVYVYDEDEGYVLPINAIAYTGNTSRAGVRNVRNLRAIAGRYFKFYKVEDLGIEKMSRYKPYKDRRGYEKTEE